MISSGNQGRGARDKDFFTHKTLTRSGFSIQLFMFHNPAHKNSLATDKNACF
jgi:hypothetical protein